MLGEQANREYRSGDPDLEAHCTECGVALYEGEYVVTQADEAFCLVCDAEGASHGERSERA